MHSAHGVCVVLAASAGLHVRTESGYQLAEFADAMSHQPIPSKSNPTAIGFDSRDTISGR